MNKNRLTIENIPLYYFESIDSTSTFARELEIEKEALVIAEEQTKGRGRIGHTFFSPKGGLYFSYVFRDDRQLGDLTVEVGRIVLNRLKEQASPEDKECLSIHGVNDIFLSDRKICGILCEHILDKYIVGIGINTKNCEFPEDIKTIAGYIKTKDSELLITSIVSDIKKVLK